MWVAEFEFDGKNFSVGKYAYDHHVSALLYINSYTHDAEGHYVVNYTLFLDGEPTQIRAFVRDLRIHEKVLYLKLLGNRLFCQLRQDKQYAATYQPDFIFLEPIEVNLQKDGMERSRIYSWNKQSLVRLSQVIHQKTQGALKKIYQTSNPSFLLTRAQPHLTAQQQRALAFAVQHGYYHVPRRVTLARLARIMGVNYSTFQVHLRKAERALFPFFYNVHHQHAATRSD